MSTSPTWKDQGWSQMDRKEDKWESNGRAGSISSDVWSQQHVGDCPGIRQEGRVKLFGPKPSFPGWDG